MNKSIHKKINVDNQKYKALPFFGNCCPDAVKRGTFPGPPFHSEEARPPSPASRFIFPSVSLTPRTNFAGDCGFLGVRCLYIIVFKHYVELCLSVPSPMRCLTHYLAPRFMASGSLPDASKCLSKSVKECFAPSTSSFLVFHFTT